MATWNAFYIKTHDAAEHTLPRVAARLHELRRTFRGTLKLKPASTAPWIEVERAGFDQHPQLMRELSSWLETDVVGCVIQTTAGVLDLYRFQNGIESRYLQYGDGECITKRGTPELWEADVLERRDEDGELELDPDPWECLRRSLELSEADWEMLRQTKSSVVVRGASREWAEWLAKALVIVGTGSCTVSAAINRPVVGAAGFVVAWLGMSIYWRRASVVVAAGGGLLAAVVLLLLGAGLGSLFR